MAKLILGSMDFNKNTGVVEIKNVDCVLYCENIEQANSIVRCMMLM